MGTGPKIAIGIVVLAVLLIMGLPIVAGLIKQQDSATTETKAQETAQTATPPPSAAPQAYVPPQATPQPQQFQQPQGPQQWTTQNFGGTAWSIYVEQLRSSIVVQFNKGGSVSANVAGQQVSGNWSINGNRLNLSAMGQQVSCIIQGWKVYLPTGGQAQRVQ